MKFIITESQAKNILENQLDFNYEVDEDYLYLLCNKSKNRNSPACELLKLRPLLNDELKKELNDSVKILNNFFGWKNAGLLPKIFQLAISHSDRTVSFLNAIADFIMDDTFSDDKTKEQLRQLKDKEEIPDNLEDLLKDARIKEYTKYENEFVGNYFDAKRTSLSLKYKCGDNIEDKFIDIVGKSRDLDKKEFRQFLNKIQNCITVSLKKGPKTKADVVSKAPLYIEEDGQKIEVFPSGSNFEIKKMDTNIDSYLSEFFSIFKNKVYFDKKETHLDLYNNVIQGIYNWINEDANGNQFLLDIKNELSGMIYDNYTIIPIEYIEFYWSNQGQRDCEVEKRLSIRFRINPKFKGQTIPTYIFNKNSDILEKKEMVVSPKEVKYNIC
jgi:hypothetical protein